MCNSSIRGLSNAELALCVLSECHNGAFVRATVESGHNGVEIATGNTNYSFVLELSNECWNKYALFRSGRKKGALCCLF